MKLRIITLFAFLIVCKIYGQKEASEKPNVVFIISDQHKLEATGAYGSTIAITPNIDALAKTGIKFTNAYTPAPVCAPARASLITGMYPYANGAVYHKAPVELPNGKIKNMGSGYMRETGYHSGITTLPEIFKSQNYITAAPGKMHVHGELQKNVDEDYKQGNSLGFDESSLRYYTYFPGGHYEDEVGSDTYMRYRQFKKYAKTYKKGSMHLNEEYVSTLVKNDEDNFDMVVAKKSIEFINKRGKDKKNFFLHVGFEKPHAPFTTTQKYLDMYNPKDFTLPKTYDDWYTKGKYPWSPNWIHSGIPKHPEKAQNVMAAYHACITEMDDMVGRVIQSLKDNGLYENTIIIYTTDHGEHLFEHGLRGKHNMLEDAVNVPFIIAYPKLFKQNVTNTTAISFIDLMPTLAELINGETPKTAQGVSLVNLLKTNSQIKERGIFSEFRGGNYNLLPNAKNVPSRMMRKGNYKFVYTHGIIDQLYNIEDDPEELNNLIFSKKYSKIYEQMRFETLVDWRFQEYSPLEIAIKNGILRIPTKNEFDKFSVFFSRTNSSQNAECIISESTGSIKLKKKGFYWVVTRPKFTKTSKFYGEEIPVAVKNYSYTLPISDALEYTSKN